MKFIIPTLGRINKQKTFSSIPGKFKNSVIFIVQSHEYEEMCDKFPDNDVLKLPEEIKTIGPTRQWIFDNFRNDLIFVLDDDLEFTLREPKGELQDESWKQSSVQTEEAFKQLLQEVVYDRLDAGNYFGSMMPVWVKPSSAVYPFYHNYRNMTNCWFYNKNLPDLDFTRVPYAEDFDVTLQLISKGYSNSVSTKWIAICSETNSEGGCSVHRTLERHNESQIELGKLWPDFVTVKDKEVKSGPWKGQIKKSTRIQFAKAFKKSQIVETVDLDLI